MQTGDNAALSELSATSSSGKTPPIDEQNIALQEVAQEPARGVRKGKRKACRRSAKHSLQRVACKLSVQGVRGSNARDALHRLVSTRETRALFLTARRLHPDTCAGSVYGARVTVSHKALERLAYHADAIVNQLAWRVVKNATMRGMKALKPHMLMDVFEGRARFRCRTFDNTL